MMPADTDAVFGLVASDLGGGVCQRYIVDVGEGEMAATARQRDGDCASDSAGCSGDDGCAAFEIQHDRGTSHRLGTASYHSTKAQAPSHWRSPPRRARTADLTKHCRRAVSAVRQFDAQLEAVVDCNKMDCSRLELRTTSASAGRSSRPTRSMRSAAHGNGRAIPKPI